VFLHVSMKQHIAAAVLSIMCVCVWYIVEHAQARDCCTGCFRRLGAFVVSPVSKSSEVMRAVLGWLVHGCGLSCPPRFYSTHAVCAMSCACVLGSHVHCVRLSGLVSDAHHAVAVTLAVAVAVAVALAYSAVPREACQQEQQRQQQVESLTSIYVYVYIQIYICMQQQYKTFSKSIYMHIHIYIYIYICAAAAAGTLQTAADVPLRASMPYSACLCSHYLFYMLSLVEPVTC